MREHAMTQMTTRINSVFETPDCETVLVVNGLSPNNGFWRNILAPIGYRALSAENVGEALQLIRSEKFSLIVSAVNVQGLNGFELLTSIKADPEFACIPFVFISSTLAENKERLLGFLLGADAFIEDPVDVQELLNEIESCLHIEETNH